MNYTLKVEYNKNSDEYYIILPPKLLEELKWKEGDNLKWHINKDGTISIKKI